MVEEAKRLYFIDAMRAWAILMMLQGHFIDGLLDPVFRDPANPVYQSWEYFRGITAPVFFTVSGFIFTYLLLRAPRQGVSNPRIRKGLRRGLELIGIGYLLRTNLLGLLKGSLYESFFLVDVLHCIGISLLLVLAFYLLAHRLKHQFFPMLLLGFGLLLFLFEPIYKTWDYSWMPQILANYFTRANGTVFTVLPWTGYASIGGFLAWLFYRYRKVQHLYLKTIGLCLAAGALLVWYSSPLFHWVGNETGLGLFHRIVSNNYLFMRLGEVFLVFALFIILRRGLEHNIFLKIGQNTLSIYVIHFIILYGSFTGIGLYRYFHHALNPVQALLGALAFMFACTWLALFYDRKSEALRYGVSGTFQSAAAMSAGVFQSTMATLKLIWSRLIRFLARSPRN